MTGIVTFGAYVPRLRLPLRMIVDGQPGAKQGRKTSGERSVCNWDEDVITMGVEAARDCLQGDTANIASVCLTSTTAPFADRQNAGVIAGALNLGEKLASQDVGGSQRAATTALLNALNIAKQRPEPACRQRKPSHRCGLAARTAFR